MLAQALDQLVRAVELGLQLQPDILNQSDPRKKAYWCNVLSPAIQAAKKAKATGLSVRDLSAIAALVEHNVESRRVVDFLQGTTDIPAEVVKNVHEWGEEVDSLAPKLARILEEQLVTEVML